MGMMEYEGVQPCPQKQQKKELKIPLTLNGDDGV
jgi:hypothetical protein